MYFRFRLFKYLIFTFVFNLYGKYLMNRFKKVLPGFLFFVCLLYCSSQLSAQTIKSFAADNAKFLQDMEKFLAETDEKKAEKLVEEFTVVWNSGKISDQQKQLVYENSNAMLKKRLKVVDFNFYLKAIMGFAESNQPSSNFNLWHESMQQMLKGNVRRFSDYLETCNGLFESNVLYESSTVKWVSGTNQFTFGFDSLAKISFPEMTLTCYAKKDSSVIYKTKGVFYPFLKTFYGDGGRVTWLRAGLPESDVYADIKKYALDLSGSDYTMDSVTFYYRMIFPQPLFGSFREKILADVTVENASYPRFVSYTINQQIKELIRDADYRGGFSLHGAKMIGSGTKEGEAKLIFNRNGKPFMVLSSSSFVVKPELVVSNKASVVMYWEHEGKKDSIYHSDIEFKYLTREHELTLLRNTQSNSNSPFYDTYHKVDMYCDQFNWKVSDPLINIKMVSGGAESKLSFESDNYFREQRFRKIQGISEEHPLYKLKKYAEQTGSRVLYTKDIAASWRMDPSQVRGLLIDLSNEGFVAFESSEDKAVLKDKAYFYLQANIGKVDYDIINFESLISGKPNATINLLNFEITMRGVSRVMLSDTQNVYVVPHEQELVLKNNRNFVFGGRLHAGQLDFFGKDFAFDYDKFKLILKEVDSLRLKVTSDSLDLNGNYLRIPLKSVIEDLDGEVLIDSENNKSSFRRSPSFPVFNSTKESYVFYQYKHIFDSVYKRSDFYFKLDPFTIDSLDNYSRGGIAFNGMFNSAAIFAPMRETLLIQPDYSLGFVKATPAEGLAAYSGKGTYHDNMSLSHNGLRGRGQIDYLTSISNSRDIKFFPDSANYDADNFEIQKRSIANVAFPQVSAKDVYINWRPKEDKMFVFKKQNNMSLYDGKASLDGNLILAAKGVTANGSITFEQAQLISNNFYLNQGNFGADTADFNLKSDIENALALSTKNMKTKIDLEKRVGEFASNGSGSYVNFPLNQYICFIEQFKWYFDNKDVQFVSAATEKTNGAKYVSIHPSQDSLSFYSPEASYNLSEYTIRAKKVKEVLVADASIIPDEGNVVVEKHAKMQTFNNATVIANTTSKYHTILNATINVYGKKNYSGSGDYSYTDMARVKHLVHLSQIGVDTSYQTFANGEIPETLNFSLSPLIQYKGKVSIHASNKFLSFTGLAQLNHGCDLIEKNWFAFASEIDPEGVSIPVKNPVNDSRDDLSVAILMSSDSVNVYTSFLSEKRRKSDKEFMSAEGYLKYDAVTKNYTIANLPDPKTNYASGNAITLNDRTCTATGEGNINLGSEFGQFKIRSIGTLNNDMMRDSTTFDLFMDLDFLFSDDALKTMVDQILFNPALAGTTDNRTVYQKAVFEILGKEKGDKFMADVNLTGSPKKMPEELQHSLVLTDVKLYWDKAAQSIKSYGNIGIGFVNKSVVNRVVKGYLQIQRKRSGDAFDFYFETDPSTWYYFNYQRGLLQAVSSESKFNDIITNTKEEKRIADEKDGKAPYQYMLSTDRKKAEFVKKFNEGSE